MVASPIFQCNVWVLLYLGTPSSKHNKIKIHLLMLIKISSFRAIPTQKLDGFMTIKIRMPTKQNGDEPLELRKRYRRKWFIQETISARELRWRCHRQMIGENTCDQIKINFEELIHGEYYFYMYFLYILFGKYRYRLIISRLVLPL